MLPFGVGPTSAGESLKRRGLVGRFYEDVRGIGSGGGGLSDTARLTVPTDRWIRATPGPSWSPSDPPKHQIRRYENFKFGPAPSDELANEQRSGGGLIAAAPVDGGEP